MEEAAAEVAPLELALPLLAAELVAGAQQLLLSAVEEWGPSRDGC